LNLIVNDETGQLKAYEGRSKSFATFQNLYTSKTYISLILVRA